MRKLISLLLTACWAAGLSAQNTESLVGSWVGKVKVGQTSLTAVFNFEQKGDSLVCTFDSPDQAAKGFPVKKEYIGSDSLSLNVEAIGAVYRARRHGDTLEGTFVQGSFSIPLTMAKGKYELPRPQQPKPPYPYQTEEVVFSNEADGATLAGTLTYPLGYKHGKKVPVVLMVSGSGQQNRDEELMEHKPFLVIADYFARNGIATLRYDDRATAASVGGDVLNATTEDFMRDAAAGMDYLRKTRKFSKIGCIGHSEGASIAFMLAARGNADFIVSMAGIGVKGDSALTAQYNRILQLSGMDGNFTVADYREMVASQMDIKWMTWFIDYDPTGDIAATRCPVFALNGSNDCQVTSELNLKSIEQTLPRSGKNRVKEYPSLNHLFQHCTTGLPDEYVKIEETISPEVLADMAEWIKSVTK